MANDVRATLQNLISEISGLNKTAGHNKVAEPLSEAGSLEGGTSHPSGKVDDGTQAGTTGTQAAENSAAVKENVGAGSVDSMAEATPGSVKQDDHQLNIGTVQAMTGEDPASEDDYKETKDEPGNIEGASTSSPATVGDEKFASLDLSQKYTRLTKEAQDLLADLALVKQASPASPAAPATPVAPETPEAAAVAAGYKEAAAAGAVSDAELEAFMQGVVKEAEAIGDHAVTYYAQFLQSLQKRANELPPEAATESEDHNKPGDAGSNNGGAGGHEDAAQDIAMLEAMGNPAGGGAAAPAPAAGGAGGPDAVNELFNALVEMGVTPDDLHAIADQMAGGAGGAGAGGAEAPIPEPKIAAAKQAMQTVKRAAAAGQTWICETKTAKQRQMRQQFKLALADFVAR